jgi:purine-binding chemotaxis protein CheW
MNANLTRNKQTILHERAKRLAMPIQSKEHPVASVEIIPFQLNQESFALETKYVKEIYPLKNHCFLPCAPDFVYGLTNVRRRILPIIDLKVFFSLPSNEGTEKKLLIIENEDREFAILIDSFSNVKKLKKTDIQKSLPTLTGIRQDFLKGLIVDGTVILDGEKLLTSPHLVISGTNE